MGSLGSPDDGRRNGESPGKNDDEEAKALLPSGIWKGEDQFGKRAKTVRKVQWNDHNGNKLVEVLEFEPSETSDSDDEDSYLDACICSLM